VGPQLFSSAEMVALGPSEAAVPKAPAKADSR
jgi:hypothetical protein